ncbi:class I poly(R)-hydroxyalkanoic acid synthase [Methylovirgula sp. 4M-Z18]|nr:class I poly(R)-hydroxyalkanoic acid synthase [Methylovirgula sp. 4M-Z18]
MAVAEKKPEATAPKPEKEAPKTAEQGTPLPDYEALGRNVARFFEEGGRVLAAAVKPHQSGETSNSQLTEDFAEAAKSIGQVFEYWHSDPQRSLQAQADLQNSFIDLWSYALRRMTGELLAPAPEAKPADKRFADPEWTQNLYFDFLRQAYQVTSSWADRMVQSASDLDPHTKNKAHFWVRQFASALSPSNFPLTNPELLRETLRENGENLVRGLQQMAQDIDAGRGSLKITQSDGSKFELGVNMAVTPGKVVFRNDLIELIQYAPTTESVYKRPLLIVPPWINKFYILDLNPEKSFIRWAVAQGLTVFVVSWVNPDERHRRKSFDSYMQEGIFAAVDAIEDATGETDITAIGYCVGGTLLAATLAYMADVGDKRISSATLFTTQVDFRDPGELKVFVDEDQIRAIEGRMAEKGYLDGSKMANAFNMLRPNELIWSYFVNNYLKGRVPGAFDLLTWNSDSTRMTEANHSFYLRNCYLENNLTRGRMVMGGHTLDLGKVTIPIYDLATKEDHIAPAKSVFIGAQYFGGPVRYVLAGSGHIAGVVNPVGKPKYQYWIGPQPAGEFGEWMKQASEHPGTWWVDWIEWVTGQAPEKVAPRTPGEGKLKPLADAPGTYVRVRA